ncbi:hypothetical protein ACFHW2_02685 [Actinomadura sp. LOL_016]|uniref:hypothetical protein n=1 Tax=unclassified Actinomadura TaxID=2626254 RepID=UPI003A809DE3
MKPGRARRRVAASRRRGPWGAWAAYRLFAAGRDRDPDARDGVRRIARTPEHRFREDAKAMIAAWWAETRDPGLRQAVLDTGAVAVANPARLRTLALHDRLGEWGVWDAGWVPELLADPDPDVRERAADACRNASGTLLGALWTVGRRGTPLSDLLLRNDEPPPRRSLDALWTEWLETADGTLGEALFRWGAPSTDPRHGPLSAIAVAADPEKLRDPAHRRAFRDALALDDHPLCDRAAETIVLLGEPALVDELCERALADARLARLCRERGLAPADPVRRGVFFLLTGQPDQHRALDPDGRLLALAYAAASDGERARIRDAMLTAGELDLVHVVAGDRLAHLGEDEARYLAERLAARREWDDLWTLVKDAPIATGVELVRLLDHRAPRDDDERRYFGALRAADPATVRAGLSSLRNERRSAIPHARLDVPGNVGMMSFSPDARSLAVGVGKSTIVVFDLGTGQITRRYEFDRPVRHLLHLGDGVLIVAERTRGRRTPDRLTRCADGTRRPLHATPGRTVPGEIVSLVAVGDGFAAGTRGGGWLLRGTTEDVTEARSILGYGNDFLYADIIAAHRASGRIAVHGLEGLTVIDTATGDVTARRLGSLTYRAAFIDADTLVHAGTGASGDRLTRTSLPHGEPGPDVPLPAGWNLGPVVLPVTGQVVVADEGGALDFLDGERLTSVHRRPAPRNRAPARCLAVSPREDFLAVGHEDGVELFDVSAGRVPDIARKPVADLVPRDLELVDASLAAPEVGADARTVLELVRASLLLRFRFDVEVGRDVRPAGGEHDISL